MDYVGFIPIFMFPYCKLYHLQLVCMQTVLNAVCLTHPLMWHLQEHYTQNSSQQFSGIKISWYFSLLFTVCPHHFACIHHSNFSKVQFHPRSVLPVSLPELDGCIFCSSSLCSMADSLVSANEPHILLTSKKSPFDKIYVLLTWKSLLYSCSRFLGVLFLHDKKAVLLTDISWEIAKAQPQCEYNMTNQFATGVRNICKWWLCWNGMKITTNVKGRKANL